MAPKPHAPTGTDAKVIDNDNIQPSVVTSAASKLRKSLKPARPAPELAVSDTDEQEVELTYDRVSVAPSEGSQFGHTRRAPGSGRLPAATYECLPPNAARDKFKDVYMPTVTKYLGKLLAEIWGSSSSEHVRIFQSVWNEVFPMAPYSFSTAQGARCNVTRLVSQFITLPLTVLNPLCRSASVVMNGMADSHLPQLMPYST